MSRYKCMKCFLILLFCILGVTGCGAEEYMSDLFEAAGISPDVNDSDAQVVTIAELEELAQENTWREDIAGRVSFEEEGHSTYAYESLTDVEKIWYEDINLLLSTRYEESIQLSQEGLDAGLTEEDVDKIYQCVLIDHPEYFYVDGYQYTKYTAAGKLLGIEMSGTYTEDMQECILRKAQIEEEADKLLAAAPVTDSDYEKIKYVYETLIFNTEYDLNAADNQNIYSVFVGKASVCQGYAKATQYLLNRLGVECTLVSGKVSDGEAHSWNLVKSAEEYYYVDTTWGDASYTSDGELIEESEAPGINYDYLCVTTEQLFKTHVPEYEFELPVCNAMQDNYYVKEGCYFYSFDEEQLKREFAEAYAYEEELVTIKCDSDEVYRVMCTELLENQKVFEYLDGSSNSIVYIDDEKHLSLTFWVTK